MTQSTRMGVIAVIQKSDAFLTIERSKLVRSPNMLCFPGGGVEANETAEIALCRELYEEMTLEIEPRRLLFSNSTPSGFSLQWWLADIDDDAQPQPNPLEVAGYAWMTIEAMLGHPKLLPSNREFLRAVQTGLIRLDP